MQSTHWLSAMQGSVQSYRQMIDAIVEQLTDDELFAQPADGINSIAIILRHLGGNLASRWTDFLTTDGEKPERNRDTEFMPWGGDRPSLMNHFNQGWQAFELALGTINDGNIDETIYIRGEPHSVPQAVTRAVTHVAYHVGQMAMIARMVHVGPWKWLTVAPGTSAMHNERTWGTSASRSVFAESKDQSKGPGKS